MAEPAQPIASDSQSRRPGPDRQESKLLLLDVYEMIKHMKECALGYAAMAHFLARTGAREDYESAKEWMELSQALGDIERDGDQMIYRLSLDRSRLFDLYVQMPPIRNAWMRYRTRDLTPVGQGMSVENQEGIWKEEQEWNTIITNIKKMLVASR